MHVSEVIVRFKKASDAAEPGPFEEELARFAAADPRWRPAIELSASRLSAKARTTLGVALSGLDAGRAPALMPFDIPPDDEAAMEREIDHMDARIVTGLGMLVPARLGLGSDEIAAVQGIVTAVHRLLRIAKTRP